MTGAHSTGAVVRSNTNDNPELWKADPQWWEGNPTGSGDICGKDESNRGKRDVFINTRAQDLKV